MSQEFDDDDQILISEQAIADYLGGDVLRASVRGKAVILRAPDGMSREDAIAWLIGNSAWFAMPGKPSSELN